MHFESYIETADGIRQTIPR